MPTSATGTSTEVPASRREPGRLAGRVPPGAVRGFSLLELLIVVTIIGIFAGVAVLSLGLLGNDRQVEHEALRLKSLMDLLREQAVMQSHDYGVLFSEDGYRFYVYDYAEMKWVPPTDDRLFGEHKLVQPLGIALRLEDRDVVLDGERKNAQAANEPAPQVVILSSGEMTPFSASIFRDTSGRFVLTAGLDGKIEITEDGFGKTS